ncbi:protein NO VEIN domain-containing protein [Asaia lannensis]|uniref:DUF3883 domain-containing protein n=1 Tax=Asaia lannensis NBRC 102526 TaxID=1307926 RepID=A0ABT1CC66_9PROT|nr:DUF3883 domain-containing protein [Asaia lannensis]MCO6158452.1 DUF3883 domain-containing protein [Asaia lannensis NBRC 102526]GBR01194.1 hypothetical protein AA102526_2436 [Asaia lannensis NBRC 102526]
MNRPLIVLHGIHLNNYDGSLEGFYAGGFKWAAENGWGGEVLNFKPTFGRCFGHVEVLEKSLHIEKLGTTPTSDSIDNVLVVWTAPDPSPRRGRIVVGWYYNATVYRDRQQPKGALRQARTYHDPYSHESHTLSFQVEADEKDCKLLAPEERVLWIPPRKKGDKGIPGQSPVYFPELQTEVGPEIARRIRHFIETGKALPLAEAVSPKSGSKGHRFQPDPEKRKEIEDAAMRIVTEHFKVLGYNVDDVSIENRGYDLVAVQGDATLCIEVKGRSGSAVVADFTFNEFDKIRLEQRGKFLDGSYRICIVTDALGERGSQKLHHFWCVTPPDVAQTTSQQRVW